MILNLKNLASSISFLVTLTLCYFVMLACGNGKLSVERPKVFQNATVYKTTYSFKDLDLKSASTWKYAVPTSTGYLLHAPDGVVERLDSEDRLTLMRPLGEEKGSTCPTVCFFNAGIASFWMLKGREIATLGKAIFDQQKQEILKVELPVDVSIALREDGIGKLLGTAPHFAAFESSNTTVVLILKASDGLVSQAVKFTSKEIGTEHILGFEVLESGDVAFIMTDSRIKKGTKDKQNNFNWSDAMVFPAEIAGPLKTALWASLKLDPGDKNILSGLIYSNGQKIFRMQSVITSTNGSTAPNEFTPSLEKAAINACAGCHDNKRGAGFANANRAASWFGAQSGEVLRRLEDKTMPPAYAEEAKSFDAVDTSKPKSDRDTLIAWLKAAGVQATKVGAGAKSVVSADPAKKEAQSKIFTTDIKPLITQFCVRCHGAWEFENNFATSLGNAKYKLGNSSMPKSGSPESIEITKLNKVTTFVNFLDAYVKAGE